MKKTIKLAVLLQTVVMIMAIFAFTGCGDKTSISIAEDKKPQVVFVQGNELDLSGGTLKVKTKSGIKEIPLDSEGVSVSGYNKDKLGAQKLTVKYGKASTSLTVTVVARVTAEEYTSKYFKDEPFDKTCGEIRYTNDDATSFTVPIGDERVNVVFDSSTVGKNVAVVFNFKYNNELFTGTFSVSVEEITESSINAPNKVDYLTHEALDLDGGYLTLKGGSGLNKVIPLYSAEVSGYNPASVTDEYATQPCVQTVTVKYAGKTFEFSVNIKYSYVTYVDNLIAENNLDTLDFSTSVPQITDTQGENAYTALDKIMADFEMQESIPMEKQLIIARVASVYAYKLWAEEFAKYGSFALNDGVLSPVCATFEGTKTDLSAVESNQTLKNLYDYLQSTLIFYSNGTLYGEGSEAVTFGGYYGLFSYENSGYDAFISEIHYIIDLYGKKNDAPETVVSYIKDSGFSDYNYGYLYSVIASWDEEFFTPLFAYAHSIKDSEEYKTLLMLCNLYLPYEYADLKKYVDNAFLSYLYLNTEPYYSSDFMVYYLACKERADAIINSDDEVIKCLYTDITYGAYFENQEVTLQQLVQFMCNYSSDSQYLGFADVVYPMYDDLQVMQLWEKYAKISLAYYEQEGYASSQTFYDDVAAMLNNFISLEPSRQGAFLSSLNVAYSDFGSPEFISYGIPSYITDYSQKVNCKYVYFTQFIGEFASLMEGNSSKVFVKLMKAIEDYDRDNESGFVNFMKDVCSEYSQLTAEEKASFDGTVGYIYNKYLSLYNLYGESGEITPSTLNDEWTKKFDEFAVAVDNVQTGFNNIQTNNDYSYWSIVVSAFEVMDKIAQEVKVCNNADVEKAFYYDNRITLKVFNEGAVSGQTDTTPDKAWAQLRGVFSLCVANYWEMYKQSAISPFMVEAYSIMLDYFQKSPDFTFDKEKVLTTMRNYRQLSGNAKFMFTLLEYYTDADGAVTYGCYYSGVKEMFKQNISDANVLSAANKLVDVEIMYSYYAYLLENGQSGQTLDTAFEQYSQKWTEFLAAYNVLSDKTAFEEGGLLGEMYAYYLDAYTKANA